MIDGIQLKINEHTFLKNPNSSQLGLRILSGSIDLLAECGFESFTFKKLATLIKSTEASVYRYFESKHQLLLYLTNWYWSWMLYKLQFALANVEDYEKQLKNALELIVEPIKEDVNFSHINEVKLYQIIINDSVKAHHTHLVDEDNKEGAFKKYKTFVGKIAEIIKMINPDYKYPTMLVSTIIEGVHNQKFFADHLPKLTNKNQSILEFYQELLFKTITQEGDKQVA